MKNVNLILVDPNRALCNLDSGLASNASSKFAMVVTWASCSPQIRVPDSTSDGRSRMDQGRRAIGLALLAALLFGVTTPAAKALLSVTDPWLLAGLLYIGSG